jgi:hypothetical protein
MEVRDAKRESMNPRDDSEYRDNIREQSSLGHHDIAGGDSTLRVVLRLPNTDALYRVVEQKKECRI